MKQSTQQIAIIGGGLAGSFLALRLMMKGHSVYLFDEPRPNTASKVAAGLFNVITGRYGAKSWKADLLLKEIYSFIHLSGGEVLQKHIHYSPIYRPFGNIRAYNKWVGRSEDPAFKHLVNFQENPLLEDQLYNDLGGIMILPCGWADTAALIDTIHQLIIDRGNYFIQSHVDYSNIYPDKHYLIAEGKKYKFDHLVFCEGYRAENNPFFPQVKIIPNKGDLLFIESKNLKLPFVLSKKVFVIPIKPKEHLFLVGSTYKNHVREATISMESRKEICHYLNEAIKMPYKIVDQRAGIRPTTPNRRPIVGTHSAWNHIHILTGLGTKGMLLAPYTSALLTQRIIGQEIRFPTEIGLARFD